MPRETRTVGVVERLEMTRSAVLPSSMIKEDRLQARRHRAWREFEHAQQHITDTCGGTPSHDESGEDDLSSDAELSSGDETDAASSSGDETKAESSSGDETDTESSSTSEDPPDRRAWKASDYSRGKRLRRHIPSDSDSSSDERDPNTGVGQPRKNDACEFSIHAKTLLGSIPPEILTGSHECFCHECTGNAADTERQYILLALKLPAGCYGRWEEKRDIMFHGTSRQALEIILAQCNPQLFAPGEVAENGKVVGIQSGHYRGPFERFNEHTQKLEYFNPNQVFVSRLKKYAELYSSGFPIKREGENTTLVGNVFLVVSARQGAYKTGQQTVRHVVCMAAMC